VTRLLANVTSVSVAGRGILIEGPPGSGKSTLALGLIDRGASLVGDDGVVLERRGVELWALPPPRIAGLLEVRGVGLIAFDAAAAPLALVLSLGRPAERLPEPDVCEVAGIALPRLGFDSAAPAAALRAEWALRLHGNAVRARLIQARTSGSARLSLWAQPCHSRSRAMSSESPSSEPRVVIVTGMSGAGKSTALEVLEDLGWETIDNAPIRLLEGLLTTGPAPNTPLAIGVDSRTRGYDPAVILALLHRLIAEGKTNASILFLDANRSAIRRRYNETRRPHPLARGRPVGEGIKAERELLEPLRRRAEVVIDTSDYAGNQLQQVIRNQFGDEARGAMTISIVSFGFARGMPPLADLVFDMRFLDNPHWDPLLRPQTGLDAAVAAHIEADPAFAPAFARIRDLVLELLPRYAEQQRAYLTIAFGCTGGKHRSVYAAEKLAAALRESGREHTVIHRNLPAPAVPAQGKPSQGS
jgi:UPF0042 nucleotide-binding protein